jgi:hypothetical protein
VLTRIGKTDPRNTSAIFDSIPMPSQMISTGSSATRGVVYAAMIKGSSK